MAAAYLKAPAVEVRQTCRKIRYESRRDAVGILGRTVRHSTMTEHGEGKLCVYRCRWCRGFHIGHLPGTARPKHQEAA